jgi:tetratricopeptide (TPR) repeat protein
MRLFIIDASLFLGLGLIFMKDREPYSDGQDTEVERLLAEADAYWRRGGPAAALALCEEAARKAAGCSAESQARVFLKRGQILESGRTPEHLIAAWRSHEAGLAALGESGACAQGARATRAEGRVRLRALLWMNRANALLAMERAEEAREALRSYDQTLAILENEVAAGEKPQEGRSDSEERVAVAAMIGAAWLNRAAAARLALSGMEGHQEQGRCLRRAIKGLSVAAEAGLTAARRNLAGAWLNLGAWREAAGDGEGALDAWRESVRVAAAETRRDPLALEATLRARHALCVAQGKRHAAGEEPGAVERAELFAQVEEGLADFEAWSGGAKGAEPIATRLFEFGAWWFQRAAPERLAEFLRRNAGVGRDGRLEAARVAAELARQEILGGGFAELSGERGEERRARLRELSVLIEFFAERREACRQARGAR